MQVFSAVTNCAVIVHVHSNLAERVLFDTVLYESLFNQNDEKSSKLRGRRKAKTKLKMHCNIYSTFLNPATSVCVCV